VHEFDRVLDRDDVVLAFLLTKSMSVASVVDVPDPVGPVTTTSPLLWN